MTKNSVKKTPVALVLSELEDITRVHKKEYNDYLDETTRSCFESKLRR